MKKHSVLSIGILLLFVSSLSAQKWEPYNFKGNESYTFKILSMDGNEKMEATYGMDIKETGKTNDEGEKLYEITSTSVGNIPENELGAQTAFGFWGAYGVSLSMAFLNPMYSMFITQMDLKVGEQMSFYGAGKAKVTGKETLAGRDGYIVEIYQSGDDGNDIKVNQMTIDPDVAFPLKSIMYDGGEEISRIELIKYSEN